MASTGDIKTRLEAVLDTLTLSIDGDSVTFTKITPYDDTRPIPEASLPAYCVYQPGKATHTKQSSSEVWSNREWPILFFIAGMKDDNPTAKQDAYEACYPYLDALEVWFAQHMQLADFTAQDDENPNGLPGIIGMGIRDEGVGETGRGSMRYAAIAYRLNITNVAEL